MIYTSHISTSNTNNANNANNANNTNNAKDAVTREAFLIADVSKLSNTKQ